MTVTDRIILSTTEWRRETIQATITELIGITPTVVGRGDNIIVTVPSVHLDAICRHLASIGSRFRVMDRLRW